MARINENLDQNVLNMHGNVFEAHLEGNIPRGLSNSFWYFLRSKRNYKITPVKNSAYHL